MDNNEHEFNKQNAQLLMIELNNLIYILLKFCETYYDQENIHTMISLLKYIVKLSNRLYFELDAVEMVNIDYE